MGLVIIYSHLQATGLVNDHIVDCFRYEQIKNMVTRPKNNI
ncbi:DNA-3-methyladenine glycosylase I [Crassaminicella profunda]|nr:DNA-3-methyladenine glycosylase I [Crassaminicella profunda]